MTGLDSLCGVVEDLIDVIQEQSAEMEKISTQLGQLTGPHKINNRLRILSAELRELRTRLRRTCCQRTNPDPAGISGYPPI